MAQCKYCHETITRLDKDVCPFCGGLKPLEGTDTSTQDITKVIGQVETKVEIKHKKKIIAMILAIVLGFLGINSLYLGKIKHCLITLGISVILIGGIGSLIYFVTWQNIFAYLIPYFVIEILMILVGVGYLLKHDVTDAHGEFLE